MITNFTWLSRNLKTITNSRIEVCNYTMVVTSFRKCQRYCARLFPGIFVEDPFKIKISGDICIKQLGNDPLVHFFCNNSKRLVFLLINLALWDQKHIWPQPVNLWLIKLIAVALEIPKSDEEYK